MDNENSQHFGEGLDVKELRFPTVNETSPRTRYILLNALIRGSCFFLDKERVHGIFGNSLVHGSFASLR